MNKSIYIPLFFIFQFSFFISSCSRPSRVEQYRAEKHIQDSVRLEEQTRSLAFYESQLEALMPTADSLIALFQYEKNDKYQDHGYYVVRTSRLRMAHPGLRILVRDDGQEMLVYKEGKRLDNPFENLPSADHAALDLAEQLRVTISDIKELEHRISHTSLEIQKYQKQLEK